MEDLLSRAEVIMNKADPQDRVGLYVDEWGTWYRPAPGDNPAFLFQQNTIRDAVVAGATFNIFHQHAKRVRMANIAQLVNVLQALILTEGERIVLTPTYHVFDMYQVHHDGTSVPLDLKTDNYTYQDGSIPALSASASRDSQGRLHVSLVNLDPQSPVAVDLGLEGGKFARVSGRILTGEKMDSHNTFQSPNQVRPAPFTKTNLQGSSLKAEIPPRSVVVLTLDAG
jgi:alpha-N-arabinofuranosidase